MDEYVMVLSFLAFIYIAVLAAVFKWNYEIIVLCFYRINFVSFFEIQD